MKKGVFLTSFAILAAFNGCSSGGLQLSQEQISDRNGLDYYAQKRYKEAINEFKIASAQNSSNTNIQSELATAYCKDGQYSTGIQIFNTLIYNNPAYFQYFIDLSSCDLDAQQYDDAMTAAKRAATLSPNNSSSYYLMGQVYEKQDEYSKAIEMYQQALMHNPQRVEVSISLANLYMHEKNVNEALNTLTRANKFSPKNSDPLKILGKIYYGLGDFEHAKEMILKAIELYTHSGVGLGLEHTKNGNVIKTIVPDSPAAKTAFAVGDLIEEIAGQDVRSLPLFYTVNRIKGPKGTPVTITVLRGDKELSSEIIRDDIVASDSAEAFELLSMIERRLGERSKAQLDAQKAYELDSNKTGMSLALIFMDTQQYDKALSLLEQKVSTPQINLYKAIVYAKMNKMQRAKDIYMSLIKEDNILDSIFLKSDRNELLTYLKPIVEELLREAKENEANANYKQSLELYTLLLNFVENETQAQQIMQAMISDIQKMQSIPPLNDEANKHVVRAEMFIKDGDFNIAIQELNKAIRYAPFSPILYYNSALLEAKLQNYPLAIKTMNIYIQMVPQAPNIQIAKDQVTKWEVMLEVQQKNIAKENQKIDTQPIQTDENLRSRIRQLRTAPR